MHFDGKSSNLSQCQINMSIAKCLKINVVSFEVKITSVLKRFTIIIEQATRRLMPAIFSFENSNQTFKPHKISLISTSKLFMMFKF